MPAMQAQCLPSLDVFLGLEDCIKPSEILVAADPDWLGICPWIDACQFEFGNENDTGDTVVVCTCPDGSSAMIVCDEMCRAERQSFVAESRSALGLAGINWS